MTVLKRKNPLLAPVHIATVDPDWFASSILNTPNDPFQSELINAIADLDRIRLGLPTLFNHDGLTRFTVRSCHGTGKTHTLAKLMHWFNFTRKGRIPVTAPKEKQVTTRVWPEFRKIRGNAMVDYQELLKVEKTQIMWASDPDWCALVETASQPENLQGLHDDHLMFLIEEASGVDEDMFPVIEGAMSTENAILVLIGNPTKTEGEFYNSHRKPGTMELYYKMHVKPEDSPRVSMKWVNEMKSKYGEKSPIYKVRCLGEFAETTPNQLIAMDWIFKAKNKDPIPDGSLATKRISVDVGDGGEDETVITAAIHYDTFIHVVKQYRFSFPTAESAILTADAVEVIAEKFGMDWENGDDIVVDSLGVGSGAAGELIQREYPVVIYKGGEASDDSTEWLNRRTQSYIGCRDYFRDGKIALDEDLFEGDDDQDWDDLIGQLTMIKVNPGIERVEALEPKRKLKKSPDMADSLAMQFATQEPTIGSTKFDPTIIGELEMNSYDASISE